MAEIVYPQVGYGLTPALEDGDGSYNWPVLIESGTGASVKLEALGIDSNINIRIKPKGTGVVQIGSISVDDTLIVGADDADYLQLSGSATGGPVTIAGLGTDTNVNIKLDGKGQGWTWVERLYIHATTQPGFTDTFRRLQITTPVIALTTTTGLVRLGGNFFATGLASSFTGGVFAVGADTDNVTFADTGDGYSAVYNYLTLTTGWTGGRTLSVDFVNVTGAGTAGASAFTVAGSSEIRAGNDMDGRPGGEVGSPFARNEIVWVQSGAGPHIKQLFSSEWDVAVAYDAQALWKGGGKVVALKQDGRRGLQEDFGFSVGMQASGTAPGFQTIYAVGGVEGWWSATETSSILRGIVGGGIANGPAAATAFGVDFSNLTRIRVSAFASPNFKVDGSGNLGALVAGGGSVQTRSEVVAKTAVVATIEAVNMGLIGSGGVTLALDAPTVSGAASGTTATATVAAYGLRASNSISANGSNFAVGDVFSVDTGAGTVTAEAVFTGTIADNILTVSAITSGSITTNSVIHSTCVFTGSISGTTLTVSAVKYGALGVGQKIQYARLTDVVTITALGTGSGGTGTYTISPSQTASSQQMTSFGIIANTKIINQLTGAAGSTGTYTVDTSQNSGTGLPIRSAGNPVGVVTKVSAGGVLGFLILNPGRYTVLPTSPVSITAVTGSGSGLTFVPLYGVLAVTVSGAGTNYSEFLPPAVSVSGTIYSTPTFRVTMTATQADLVLNSGGNSQVSTLVVNASGPTMRSGTGAASGTQPKGSLWLRTDGGVGTTLYVSQGGGTWNAVAGV